MIEPLPIPEVRERGCDLANRLRDGLVTARQAADELAVLMEQARRHPPISHSRAHSTPMTAELRDRIKRAWATGRWKSQHALAYHLGCSQGRVSEALNGRWDHLG